MKQMRTKIWKKKRIKILKEKNQKNKINAKDQKTPIKRMRTRL